VRIRILLCLALILWAGAADAMEYEGFGPFTTRNQNPVYLQTLSLTPMRATTLPEGVMEARIDSAYSSVFDEDAKSGNVLDMQMEIWRLAPHIDYGLTDDFEIGLEVPLLHFSGGFLGSFIQKFHKAFGFPNAGRDLYPGDRFSYRFAAGGANLMNFPPATFGLGDIVISAKHQITGEDDNWPAISVFADLKFPTGRKSRGFGNGSPDLGVGGALDASWKRLHGYFNVGYFVTGGNDLISSYMQNEMLAYMIAGEVSIIPTLALIVQLNGSTPLLAHSGMEQWDGVPLDLIIGFRGEEPDMIPKSDFIWQVGFAEDVTSRGPSVDFTAFISVGVRFDIFGRSKPVGDWIAKKP
ncbi:MAG: DUF3187 family protein, partial [Pseudomonadota bacterium]